MTSDNNLRSIVEAAYRIGVHAVAYVAINPDGSTSLWTADARFPATCAAYTVPTHERTGPLPDALRARLLPYARCGAARTNGAPCKVIVRLPGARCRHHRDSM